MGAVEDTRTDLWSIHSASAYSQDVVRESEAEEAVEEVALSEPEWERISRPEPEREAVSIPEPEPVQNVEETADDEEEADFQPIRPKRVEIIHEPEADYVDGEQELSTSAAFAQLGIFGNREPEGGRGFDARRNAVPVAEEPRGVDIRFAKGKDSGRNSNERILELHKAGKSNMAIAKELGLGLGEVKLVIDLFEGV